MSTLVLHQRQPELSRSLRPEGFARDRVPTSSPLQGEPGRCVVCKRGRLRCRVRRPCRARPGENGGGARPPAKCTPRSDGTQVTVGTPEGTHQGSATREACAGPLARGPAGSAAPGERRWASMPLGGGTEPVLPGLLVPTARLPPATPAGCEKLTLLTGKRGTSSWHQGWQPVLKVTVKAQATGGKQVNWASGQGTRAPQDAAVQ